MADDHRPGPLEALNARGLTAKREYVRGLEQRRDAEALSLLVECLCDESWFLRDLAEQAFVRLGEEHAGPLVPMLAGGLWYTRLSAARLLGRLGYRPAVPALLGLCDDANETVALAAREAVVAVARQRGTARIAHALHRVDPEKRQRRLAEIAERDRALSKNLERLMTDVDLMAADHPDRLLDTDEPARAGGKAEGLTPARRRPATKPPATPARANPKPPPTPVATPVPGLAPGAVAPTPKPPATPVAAPVTGVAPGAAAPAPEPPPPTEVPTRRPATAAPPNDPPSGG